MKYLLLLLVSFSAFSQKTNILTADSTGNTYVMFVRDDSIAVVYQGKHAAFTTNGYFAKDFSAFDMKLVGFLKFDKIANTLGELQKKTDEVIKVDETVKVDNVIKNDNIVYEPIKESGTVTELFPKQPRYQKSRYIVEGTDWDKVSSKPQTIKGMAGYDFAPIELNQLDNIWTYGTWNQEYVSIAGKRDIWQDDNATYFLKPVGYSTNLNYNLMDFDLRFPDFTLPKNKTVVMQPTPKREIGVYNYLKKGVSAVKDRRDDKGYVFVSDAWLTDLGCPPAYTSTKEAMDKWCEEVDADALLNSFIHSVYFPCRWSNVVLLNWEHVGNRWNVRKDKIIRCLEYWKNNEHTAKLGMYAVNGLSLGRPKFQGLNHNYTELLEFNGSLDEFQRKFSEHVSVDMTYAKYVEIAMVGGYMNYPIEEGVIHHYLLELLMHRKFNKEKTILANTWFDQEFINGFDIGRVKVDSEDGSYYAEVKPKVFPSVGFNWGVWSVALGDGIDVWSDPNYWTEEKRFWGWGAKDMNWNELPNKHDEVLSRYPSQPMKVIDWIMSGVYSVSINKDIIEHDSNWEFITLPTKSFHEKSVMIAYKVKGNDALILALDGFCSPDEVKEHKLNIKGKEYKIKTHGRYTSVVRMNL